MDNGYLTIERAEERTSESSNTLSLLDDRNCAILVSTAAQG